LGKPTKTNPAPPEPIFHAGAGSFTTNPETNRLADQAIRLEDRLLELETKRIPELEKQITELSARLSTASRIAVFLVSLLAAIVALVKLK
jgi:hypothetical protein